MCWNYILALAYFSEMPTKGCVFLPSWDLRILKKSLRFTYVMINTLTPAYFLKKVGKCRFGFQNASHPNPCVFLGILEKGLFLIF